QADIVILTTFIYDNTRLLLLSKTAKFPDGLSNSSGQVGKHVTAHIGAGVVLGFDNERMNVFMGPNGQKHAIDDLDGDNFDHTGLGFIRGAQINIGPLGLEGGPLQFAGVAPPPGVPRWGAAYRDFFAKYFTRYAYLAVQAENLP